MHNLNIENYVLSGSLPGDFRPTRQLLKSSEGVLKEVKEEPEYYRGFCNKGQESEHQKIAVNERKVGISG